MNIYYTPHRGTIQQSFEERQTFQTATEAIDCIINEEVELFGYPMFTRDDIYIRYSAFDSRIQCDTFMVCLGRYGAEDYLKKHRVPQCHAWLHFDPEWAPIVEAWKSQHKSCCRPAYQFIAHFDAMDTRTKT